ncbi:MAG: hypothetical protein IT367_03515 [Candidatus Hydrogenedentes bacterium]|nr:hypothetical protein [Candidatus Hydrogenedentota bacterium]
MMILKIVRIAFVCVLISPIVFAKSDYLDDAIAQYPSINNTVLDSCSLCHSSGTNRNAYGADFGAANHNFTAIENDDSDNDGFDNITEIEALTKPGDANSHPVVQASITVKKPNGGEVWTIGTKAQVTWQSTGNVGADVRIELWQNGQKVKTLKGSTPNDGKQRIALKDTLPTGSGFTVKVKSVSDPFIGDESNAGFTINPVTP